MSAASPRMMEIRFQARQDSIPQNVSSPGSRDSLVWKNGLPTIFSAQDYKNKPKRIFNYHDTKGTPIIPCILEFDDLPYTVLKLSLPYTIWRINAI
jgi:hypothetical protein